MRILFIGGTGNISADCAALLHEQRHEILVVSRGRNVVPSEYQAIVADRKDLAAMRTALAGARPDVVINFLGFDLPDVQTDYELFRGTIHQYIFISSATVYARPPERLPFTEESPLGNTWWDYAQKKLACEEWLRQRWAEDRFPATIVRPSHTYSKRWVPNPVSSASFTFAARLEHGKPVFVPDDGETPWTLTATSDFAVGLAGLVGNDRALGEAFHITSDEVLTWNQIVGGIAAAVGLASSLSPAPSFSSPPSAKRSDTGGKPVLHSRIVRVPTEIICRVAPHLTGTLKGDKAHPGIFDNSKIKRFVPEFQCRKPFCAGVRESIAWLRAHPEQQNLKPELDELIERVIAAAR